MSDDGLLSMRQYADHRGVSAMAVSKAVAQGKIATVISENGVRKIDPRIADRQWAENSDAAKDNLANAQALEKEDEDKDSKGNKKKAPIYAESRAMREYFNARKAELEMRARTGELVDIKKAAAKWFQITSVIRTKILGIPSKIKQHVPTLTISPEEYARIEDIVREALEELANGEP